MFRSALKMNASLASRKIAAEERKAALKNQGTSVEATNLNTLLRGGRSPEYAAAYNTVKQPKTNYNPATGETTVVTPNMSAFRKPTGSLRTTSPKPRLARWRRMTAIRVAANWETTKRLIHWQ